MKKEKIQLLADIVELQTENNNEIEVCNYLKRFIRQVRY